MLLGQRPFGGAIDLLGRHCDILCLCLRTVEQDADVDGRGGKLLSFLTGGSEARCCRQPSNDLVLLTRRPLSSLVAHALDIMQDAK